MFEYTNRDNCFRVINVLRRAYTPLDDKIMDILLSMSMCMDIMLITVCLCILSSITLLQRYRTPYKHSYYKNVARAIGGTY